MPTSSKILFYSLILIFNTLLISCSSDESDRPTINDIPPYPNSVKGESMQQSMFGVVGGSLQQYSSDDDFKQIFTFYKTELAQYAPEVMTHNLEIGRQSAISIEKENGGITIAIQEYKGEGKVMITFMEVSK